MLVRASPRKSGAEFPRDCSRVRRVAARELPSRERILVSAPARIPGLHEIVQSGASTDDPTLGDYWARRRRKARLPINNTNQWLLGT